MSFEEDVMVMATRVQAKAVKYAVKQQGDHPIDVYLPGGPEIYFAPIPDMFRPYSQMPDPGGYDGILDQLGRAMSILSPGDGSQEIAQPLIAANPNLELVEKSDSYLEDWTGRAAVEFKLRFLDPFPAVAKNQFLVTAILRGGVAAHRLMWDNARRDILEIAHQTEAALDSMDSCKGNGGSFVVLLSVFEAVATIAAVFTEGASLATTAAITAVGAAAGVGANWPRDKAESVPLGAELAFQVIGNMADAIRRLGQGIYNSELKIKQAMDSADAAVQGNRTFFVANRPALAGATSDTIGSPQFMGYSN